MEGVRNEAGFLNSEFGVCCPLCGRRVSRRSFFCRYCRRHGRLHLDSDDIKARPREVFLPKGLLSNGRY